MGIPQMPAESSPSTLQRRERRVAWTAWSPRSMRLRPSSGASARVKVLDSGHQARGWARRHDQKRIATPSSAVAEGSDFLVVGRPVTGPKTRHWPASLFSMRCGDYRPDGVIRWRSLDEFPAQGSKNRYYRTITGRPGILRLGDPSPTGAFRASRRTVQFETTTSACQRRLHFLPYPRPSLPSPRGS